MAFVGVNGQSEVVLNRAEVGQKVGFFLGGAFTLGTLGYLFSDNLVSLLDNVSAASKGKFSDKRSCCRCDHEQSR